MHEASREVDVVGDAEDANDPETGDGRWSTRRPALARLLPAVIAFAAGVAGSGAAVYVRHEARLAAEAAAEVDLRLSMVTVETPAQDSGRSAGRGPESRAADGLTRRLELRIDVANDGPRAVRVTGVAAGRPGLTLSRWSPGPVRSTVEAGRRIPVVLELALDCRSGTQRVPAIDVRVLTSDGRTRRLRPHVENLHEHWAERVGAACDPGDPPRVDYDGGVRAGPGRTVVVPLRLLARDPVGVEGVFLDLDGARTLVRPALPGRVRAGEAVPVVLRIRVEDCATATAGVPNVTVFARLVAPDTHRFSTGPMVTLSTPFPVVRDVVLAVDEVCR
ncbi:MAG: hypothetical protein M3Q27_02300 [Actinomycetota bacterium]|nr:hypothetical protein [Actinomycetota bacterium]